MSSLQQRRCKRGDERRGERGGKRGDVRDETREEGRKRGVSNTGGHPHIATLASTHSRPSFLLPAQCLLPLTSDAPSGACPCSAHLARRFAAIFEISGRTPPATHSRAPSQNCVVG
jgi:hypothetical protein